MEHPDHGRCVLKTWFTARHPAQALASLTAARLVQDGQASIFADVFGATSAYTLEQDIDGMPLEAWIEASFAIDRARDYFCALRTWSTEPRPFHGVPTLRPYEIRELCRRYLNKCLARGRFFGTARRVQSTLSFVRDGDPLVRRVQWLSEAADRLVLPRGLMCGDMGGVNILVQAGTGRWVNIDYETLGPGHHGFDVAYLLSSISKLMHSPEAVAELRKAVLTDEYLGGAEARAFFEVYTAALEEISQRVWENRRPQTR